MSNVRTNRFWAVAIGVVFAGLFVFKVWKAGLESSVWQDEVFCLQVVERSWSGVVDAMREDFHPPLYPLLLKGWLATLEPLGVAPTLAVARALNVGIWVLLAVWLARVARRVLGRSPRAMLLPLLVAGSAHVVQFTSDARSYGLAVAAVIAVGALVLLDLVAAGEGEAATGRARLGRWASASILASVAAWSHLLSLPLLFGIALIWLLASAGRFGWRRCWSRSLVPSLAALGFFASIAPWVLPAATQIAAYRSAAPAWMTAATGANLFRLLAEWLPFGRNGFVSVGMPALSSVISWALLAAFAVVVCRSISSSRDAASSGSLTHLAGAGFVLVGWGHAALLWLLQRLDIARMFYGPRYPCLGAGLVALGAACWLASWDSRFWTGAARVAAALWLSASMIGHLSGALTDRAGGITPFVRQAREEAQLLPDSVAAHYPSIVGEALPKSARRAALRPTSEALCALATDRPVLLVSLSPWRQLLGPSDLVLDEAIRRGLLAEETERVAAASSTDYAAWRLAGGTDLTRRWCREGVSVPRWTSSADGAWLSAAELRPEDGWSFLDFDDQLRPARWSKAEIAKLRIESPVGVSSGSALVISGFVAGVGEGPRILVNGVEAQRVEKPGVFTLCTPLAASTARAVEVELRSSLWSPDEQYHNGDPRRLGVLIREVGIVRESAVCGGRTDT